MSTCSWTKGYSGLYINISQAQSFMHHLKVCPMLFYIACATSWLSTQKQDSLLKKDLDGSPQVLPSNVRPVIQSGYAKVIKNQYFLNFSNFQIFNIMYVENNLFVSSLISNLLVRHHFIVFICKYSKTVNVNDTLLDEWKLYTQVSLELASQYDNGALFCMRTLHGEISLWKKQQVRINHHW